MAAIKVLDPTANRTEDNASPGPDAGMIAGKRIGFRLDQIWRSWDWISENWAAKFEEAGATVTTWRSTNRSGGEGEEQVRSLEHWLKTVDVVISGLANCGSCTGWTIRDAIAAANSGVPTVAVATRNFEQFAHELGARGGRSGLRVHVLPYPLNELSRAEVDRVAEEYFDDLLTAMGASLATEEKAA
jgi:hypothetical protein